MKPRLVLSYLIVFFLAGAAAFGYVASPRTYHADDFDELDQLKSKAGEIMHIVNANHDSAGLDLPKHQWPVEFRKLNPHSIRITREGLWIALHRFFVTESGVFFPNKEFNVAPSTGDPKLYFIEHGIWGYQIKG